MGKFEPAFKEIIFTMPRVSVKGRVGRIVLIHVWALYLRAALVFWARSLTLTLTLTLTLILRPAAQSSLVAS